MPIRVLDETVASQIAAGEVVERPASVVKELVENSLDAGATRIEVETRGGGIELIRVGDDGSGIGRDELGLAFDRYATSKLSDIDDLQSIATFGFRGEALPSITVVARVEVVTCAAGETGGEALTLDQGQVIERHPGARSQGTTVTVRGLFRTVPARLKFLKSTSTENSHIARVVSQYALAFPEVSFSLTIDGRKVVTTPGGGRLIDGVVAVYGADIAARMLVLDDAEAAAGGISVGGMVSPPELTRANRDYLNFFVNRRAIGSRLLAWAVEQAYHGMLMTGRHPVAIIDITLPPSEIDVNVHPTKAEVKFRSERAVFAAVQKAVRSRLTDLPPTTSWQPRALPIPGISERGAGYSPGRRAGSGPVAPLWPAPPPSETAATPPQEALVSLPALRVIGQVAASYIVAEGPDGVYLIDQHAAHERVLFDQISRQRAERKLEVQGLLEPASLEVTPAQDEILKTDHPRLAEFGFTIEPFGERNYLVRAIPALLGGENWRETLWELLDNGGGGSAADWTERVAITLACHGAVRAGKVLSDDEMRQLIRELESTALARTCPHGRPTVLHISSGQLEREVRRRP